MFKCAGRVNYTFRIPVPCRKLSDGNESPPDDNEIQQVLKTLKNIKATASDMVNMKELNSRIQY